MITGRESSLVLFEQKLQAALDRGVKLVQLRLSRAQWLEAGYLRLALSLCDEAGAKIQLNRALADFNAELENIDLGTEGAGLHLSAARLMALTERPVDSNVCLGASCHNLAELQRAQTVGVDYVLLSAVLSTDSHPEVQPLGWAQFAQWVVGSKMLVFALGGMTPELLEKAKAHGAQGVAGISAWWQ